MSQSRDDVIDTVKKTFDNYESEEDSEDPDVAWALKQAELDEERRKIEEEAEQGKLHNLQKMQEQEQLRKQMQQLPPPQQHQQHPYQHQQQNMFQEQGYQDSVTAQNWRNQQNFSGFNGKHSKFRPYSHQTI